MLNDKTTASRISEQFCGNHDVVDILGKRIDAGTIPHALIIEGEDGLGKTTLAHIVAQGALCSCEHPLEGECPHCRKVKAKIHPDIMYVTGSGKTNTISIDSIREIRKDSVIKPNEAERRVFMLEDCDNMLAPAQNAFLKIFEEAPSVVIFIITCRSATNLLDTIRSRGVIITLHPPAPDEAAEFLLRSRPDLSEKDAMDICLQSGGNIGKAIDLLEATEANMALEADKLAYRIVSAMESGSELELAESCAKVGKDRAFGTMVVDRLSEILRKSRILALGASDTLPTLTSQLCSSRSVENLTWCLDELNKLKEFLKANVNMQLFNTQLAIVLRRR